MSAKRRRERDIRGKRAKRDKRDNKNERNDKHFVARAMRIAETIASEEVRSGHRRALIVVIAPWSHPAAAQLAQELGARPGPYYPGQIFSVTYNENLAKHQEELAEMFQVPNHHWHFDEMGLIIVGFGRYETHSLYYAGGDN
jgi:hypothetical protein